MVLYIIGTHVLREGINRTFTHTHDSLLDPHLKYLYLVVVQSWLVLFVLSCVRVGELPKEDQLVVHNLRNCSS